MSKGRIYTHELPCTFTPEQYELLQATSRIEKRPMREIVRLAVLAYLKPGPAHERADQHPPAAEATFPRASARALPRMSLPRKDALR